jgi:hypothetical protein
MIGSMADYSQDYPRIIPIGPIAFVVHINGLKAVIKDTESSLINSSNDDNDDCDDA